MTTLHCNSCKRKTGFRRQPGAGYLVATLGAAGMGLWALGPGGMLLGVAGALVVLVLYPKRCCSCGLLDGWRLRLPLT